jgi:membrane protein YdbS with pleckstrin-like domain
MAKKIKKKDLRSTKKSIVSPFKIYWEKPNYLLLIAGFALIIAGYFLMSRGPWDSTSSLVISPIILILAYIVIFPAAIFFRKKKQPESSKEDKIDPGKS